MRRLLALLAILIPTHVIAQELLTQPEMEAILRENALCYVQQTDGTCSWVEVYPVLEPQRLELRIATVVDATRMVEVVQEATWIADGMCIRDGDLGVLYSNAGPPPMYRFDGVGMQRETPEATQEIVDIIAPSIGPKTCFRFARDPARAGGMFQFTFSGGNLLEGSDVITLIPLSVGSIPLFSPF